MNLNKFLEQHKGDISGKHFLLDFSQDWWGEFDAEGFCAATGEDLLEYVNAAKCLSFEEYDEASSEIVKYLSQLVKDRYSESLEEALDYNYLDSSFEARKKIYLDWDNRPKPWKEEGV